MVLKSLNTSPLVAVKKHGGFVTKVMNGKLILAVEIGEQAVHIVVVISSHMRIVLKLNIQIYQSNGI